jgi:hypothetical protein
VNPKLNGAPAALRALSMRVLKPWTSQGRRASCDASSVQMPFARREVHSLDSRAADRVGRGRGAGVVRAVRGDLVKLVVFALFIVAAAAM